MDFMGAVRESGQLTDSMLTIDGIHICLSRFQQHEVEEIREVIAEEED